MSGQERTIRKTTTHYLRVLTDHARRLGLDVGRILRETGVAPELTQTGREFVENDLLAALVKRLWRETGSENFGFDPEPVRLGTWALACEFMLEAENLGELLRKGERVLSYLPAGAAAMTTCIEDDSVSLYLGTRDSPSDPDHFLAEFMGTVWHRFPSWACDETIQLHRAFFAYPRPTHAAVYEELFPCEVQFEAPCSGFTFSRRYLKKAVVRSRGELNEWLRDSPADLLYLPGRDVSVQSQIRLVLHGALEEQRRFPAFAAICAHLGMSPSVVRRRLAEEGTSYQQLKDLVREDVARRLLAIPELRISDVALRTGFTDPAPFSRAFKKWTGMSPAQYREGGQ